MEVTADVCQLCGGVANITGRELGGGSSSIWDYLYQENVRKTLLPRLQEGRGGREEGVPVLTFTFSLGGRSLSENSNGEGHTDKGWLCKECWEQVEYLERLEEQLESCKKLIAAQVEQIENVWGQAGSAGAGEERKGGRGNRKWESLRKMGAPEGGLSVALAGTCVGGGNISQVLRSLGSLCEGIGSRHAGSPPTALNGAQPPDATVDPRNESVEENTLQEETSQKTGSSLHFDRSQVKLEEPSLPLFSAGGSSSLYKSPVTSSLEADIGQIFPSAVKVDPEGKDAAAEEETPIDPDGIQPPDYYSESGGNNDPLGEEDEPISLFTSDCSPGTSSQVVSYQISPLPLATTTPPGRKRKLPAPERPKDAPARKTGKIKMSSCKVCGKTMRCLVQHMRVHDGVKPFECDFCGRSFSLKHHLDNHRRGERFTCPECQSSFSRLAALKAHIIKVHGKLG